MNARAQNHACPLRLLFWESTARCNLACVHCRRLDTHEADDELTTDEFKRVLDSAATLGRPIVVFSGGEPLLRQDWEALAGYAAKLHLPTALATNGTMIDGKLAGRIAAAGFHRVAVSLDGADAETHDAFRGAAGAFRQALDGIRALRTNSVPVQINCTIAGHNVHQVEAVYALAETVGAEALHVFLLVPVGCGTAISDSHQLDARKYEQVLGWIREHQSGSLELKATCAPHYYRIAAQAGLDVSRSRGCLCGLSVVFVSHRGQVFPCGYLPVDCGSVREQPLADIWRGSKVFAELRDFSRLRGKCGLCEFKGICGGCRARAFAETGDYLAAEPACTYAPKDRNQGVGRGSRRCGDC